MNTFFPNKVVLLTGCVRGLGRELALQLHQSGAVLALVDLDSEGLKHLSAELTSSRSQTTIACFQANVSDLPRIQQIAQEVLAKFKRIDIVIANAGLGGINPGYDFSFEVNQKLFAVNYLGTINTLMPFVPTMLAQKSGHLVGVCSMASYRGLLEGSSYCASKAAQATFLESLRLDLMKSKIKVSTIYPGFIKTAMADHKEFPLPFMVSAPKAAHTILKAIACGQKKSRFPWSMNLLAGINRLLPTLIYDFLVRVFLVRTKSKNAQIFGG